MRFRPCIDIHNGKVKQIVGSTLRDEGNEAAENFVSDRDAAYFAHLYHEDSLKGGHVILLNPASSEYYEKTRAQALQALSQYPGELMAGGGIRPENAELFLNAGASHVIVTSYVFKDGSVDLANLERMKAAAGREHLVLDLSCRKKNGDYYIVTDRWQKFTDTKLDRELLHFLSFSCSEYLIHAVDAEGRSAGIDENIISLLGQESPIPVTYAGGVSTYEDLERIRRAGWGRVDFTIGSALDIFGGKLSYRKIVQMSRQRA